MTSSVPLMRWDDLFDDLESQLEAEIGAAEREVHDDVERERQSLLTMHDRLSNLLYGGPIELTLESGLTLSAFPIRLGRDWCAVEIVSPSAFVGHALIPIAAISDLHLSLSKLCLSLGSPGGFDGDVPSVEPAITVESALGPSFAGKPGPRIADTMSLGFVLRDLARRRRTVEVHGAQGILSGTLDRVGADHCDVAEHAAQASRRSTNVSRYRVVTLAKISLVRIR